MGIEEVLELSTIEFSDALSLKEIMDLFKRLAIALGGSFDYRLEFHERIGELHNPVNYNRRRFFTDIRGSFCSRSPLNSVGFYCEKDRENPNYFRVMRFEIFPKERIEEFRSEELELMRQLKQEVERYFASIA